MWIDRLVGDARTYTVEQRVTHALALIMICSMFGYAFTSLVVPSSDLVTVILFLLGIVYVHYYRQTRLLGRGYAAFPVVFALSQLTLFPIAFFPSYGLDGPLAMIATGTPVGFMVLMRGTARVIAIVALALEIAGLLVLATLRPDLSVAYETLAGRALDHFTAWALLVVSVSVCIGAVMGSLDAERRKNESLLHGVLPASIAERLKRNPEAEVADAFDEVAVIFSDMVGFTRLSTQIPPDELIRLLDRLFSDFDAIAARHGVEKIKTIGDAWMGVAGCPSPHPDPVVAVARTALDIREQIERFRAETGTEIRVRIGLHHGPAVGGVVGKDKFQYDVWGDTVNTAARMESHGLTGRIQTSDATAQRLQGQFVLTERGVVEIKGKGPMKTWCLDGERGSGRSRQEP